MYPTEPGRACRGRSHDPNVTEQPAQPLTRPALDQLGAEPLEGSGFETETPDPEFE